MLMEVSPAGGPTPVAALAKIDGTLVISVEPDQSIKSSGGQSTLNLDLLSEQVNGYVACPTSRSAVFMLAGSAGITTAGAVSFEQTNDPALGWVPLAVFSVASANATPTSAAQSVAANALLMVAAANLTCQFVRARISTAPVGGTILISASFSPFSMVPSATAISAFSAGTVLYGDVSLQPRATTGGYSTVYRLPSAAASTNTAAIKGAPGRVYKVVGANVAAARRYLKLFNKTSAPVLGTDTPIVTLSLGPGSFDIDLAPIGHFFSAGIAIAITGAVADADATALTAGDIEALNIWYA